MKDREDILAHVEDIWRKTEERGIVRNSPFLSERERGLFLEKIKRERGAKFLLLGGEEAERQAFFFYPSFMDEEECRELLLEDNPVVLLEIQGKQKKFSEELSHRDVLGAIMSLGIEREMLGDIFFRDEKSYVYLLRKMKDYLLENLQQIRHTAVEIKECEEALAPKQERIEEQIFAASERLDGIVSAAFHLSRGKAQEYFAKELVYKDGLVAKGSSSLKGGEKISVRGLGKFHYLGLEKNTKKGRMVLRILRYG